VTNSVIWTRSTARIFLVFIYLLNYFINRKFPAVKQSVFLLNRKFSKMWQGSKVLWNKTRGRKFQGTKVPWNFRSWDESSTLWHFRPRGRKFPGTKVPDTVV